MRRKRLKHYTDIFCDMFTGWRLSNEDIKTLQNFENGELCLDFLNEKLYFNNDELREELYILKEISAWFKENLQKDNIEISKIQKAFLLMDSFPKECEPKPKSRTKRIVQMNVNLIAVVQTDEKEYRTEKRAKSEYRYL